MFVCLFSSVVFLAGLGRVSGCFFGFLSVVLVVVMVVGVGVLCFGGVCFNLVGCF